MDEKKLAVIVCLAFVLVLFLGLLLMPRRSSRPVAENDSQIADSGKNKKENERGGNFSSSSGAGGSSAGSYGTGHQSTSSGGTAGYAPPARTIGEHGTSSTTGPAQAFTEEEMQELRNKREELRKAMYERKREWVKDKANDDSLHAKSRVRYRLKLIDGFRNGNDAFNQGDYVEAMKQYAAGLKDPNADDATRYLCYHQMRNVARLLKDADLYLEILKEQGELIENADLSGVGIDKSNRGTLAYQRRKLFVQALKGSDGLRSAIDAYCQEHDLKGSEREDAEKEFEADFEEWKNDFMSPG
jgi:hypothetical protein